MKAAEAMETMCRLSDPSGQYRGSLVATERRQSTIIRIKRLAATKQTIFL